MNGFQDEDKNKNFIQWTWSLDGSWVYKNLSHNNDTNHTVRYDYCIDNGHISCRIQLYVHTILHIYPIYDSARPINKPHTNNQINK